MDIRLRLLCPVILLATVSACSDATPPPDTIELPDGVLSGRSVVDGKPAAGASVALDGSTLHTISGENGVFTLHDLAPGQRALTISTTVDGRLYSARKQVLLAPSANVALAESRAIGDVVLVASAHVTGVVKRGGRTVAGVQVVAPLQAVAVTDDAGSWAMTLAPGTIDLAAIWVDGATTRTSWQRGVVIAENTRIKFELANSDPATATIGGRVQLDGANPADVTVTLVADGQGPVVVHPDADGHFVTPDLPSGIYTVVVRVRGRADVTVGPVVAGGSTTDLSIWPGSATDCSGNGIDDAKESDADEDGVPDAFEAPSCRCEPGGHVDFDGDGVCDLDAASPPAPMPVIGRVAPWPAPVGSPAFSLDVLGSGFVPRSLVRWNGEVLATTFVDATHLQAAVDASRVAHAGSAAITVETHAPGGGTTAATTLEIGPPPPPHGVTLLVTPSMTGGAPSAPPLDMAVSNDGRFVVFKSFARNLVANDPVGAYLETYLRDTCLGATGCTPSTTFVVVDNNGTPVHKPSEFPAMSADGRYIAFVSNAAVIDPPPLFPQLIVRDTCVGATGCTPSNTLVSVLPPGAPLDGNGSPGNTVMSADGRYIGWTGGGAWGGVHTNGVFVRDTCLGATGCTPATLVATRMPNGEILQSLLGEGQPAISTTGRFVTFISFSNQLIDGDTITGGDDNGVFLRDLCLDAEPGCTPHTELVSRANDGRQDATVHSNPSPVSADGRWVVFATLGALVADDTNAVTDVYLRDTCRGGGAGCTPSTTRISVDASGAQTSKKASSDSPAMSGDGRFIVFRSSGKLTGDAAEGEVSAYVRDTCYGAPAGCTPSIMLLARHIDAGPEMSRNGRFFVVMSTHDPLAGAAYTRGAGWLGITSF